MVTRINKVLSVLWFAIAAYKIAVRLDMEKVQTIGICASVVECLVGSWGHWHTWRWSGASPVLLQKEVIVTEPHLVLHEAVKSGHAEAVSVLLKNEHFKSINEKNDKNMTALHQAVLSGHFAVTKLLMDSSRLADRNVGIQDGYQQTELHIAGYIGSAQIAAYLLAHDRWPTDTVNMRDKDGDTALTQALLKSHNKVAELILDYPHFHGLWAKNKEGMTALHLVTRQKHMALLQKVWKHPQFNQTDKEKAEYNERTKPRPFVSFDKINKTESGNSCSA